MPGFEGAIPPPKGYTPNLARPKDILHTVNTVGMITAICLITPFVLLRIYIKAWVIRSIGREEWTCFIAFVIGTLALKYLMLICAQISFLGYRICGMFMNNFGAGYHLWEISQESFTGFQKSSYVGSILYSLTSYFTKTSLLLLFIRVFAQFRKTVIFIWLFLVFTSLFAVAITIVKIKMCTPISGIWNPSIEHTCLNRQASFVADTAMAALTDLVILIPPIPLTWSLRVHLTKKIKIMGLLGAGGLATSTSFVRLILLLSPGSFDDITVSFVRFNLLGVSEVGIGMICACLPSLNILITRNTRKFRVDSPTARGYMFSSVFRNPRSLGNMLGLTRNEGSFVEAGSIVERPLPMPEQGDLGMKFVVQDYGWLGPYVSKAEKLV